MIRAVVGAVRRAQDGVSPWLACLEADHRAIDDHFAAFGTALSEGRVEADALAAGAAGLRSAPKYVDAMDLFFGHFLPLTVGFWSNGRPVSAWVAMDRA